MNCSRVSACSAVAVLCMQLSRVMGLDSVLFCSVLFASLLLVLWVVTVRDDKDVDVVDCRFLLSYESERVVWISM